ncbi:MAG: dihydropteroate synthase [Xanthomonadales bacterium]|nr:dihydropteroate synthase [Xanthomonadales bacterium]
MHCGTLNCAGRRITLDRTRVMGILNVTPDSFSDGGRFTGPDRALRHALEMVQAGADLIDVGGESTRPGSESVGAQEELDRVIPVIEAIVAEMAVPVSIDTSKPEIMKAAAAAGAGMVNDVFALRQPNALETAASLGLPVCLMHMRGKPRDMQTEPVYDDVVAEVLDFLIERAEACEAAGVPSGQVIIDPGFGFGKNLHHNLALFRALPRLASCGYPLLVGFSRKSMLGKITGRPVDQRISASVAAAVLAARSGASLLRVHDVAETVDALAVLSALTDRRD